MKLLKTCTEWNPRVVFGVSYDAGSGLNQGWLCLTYFHLLRPSGRMSATSEVHSAHRRPRVRRVSRFRGVKAYCWQRFSIQISQLRVPSVPRSWRVGVACNIIFIVSSQAPFGTCPKRRINPIAKTYPPFPRWAQTWHICRRHYPRPEMFLGHITCHPDMEDVVTALPQWE